MNRTTAASLRRHSPWLALLLSALILVASVTLTVYVSEGDDVGPGNG